MLVNVVSDVTEASFYVAIGAVEVGESFVENLIKLSSIFFS